jgi:hypothetical protein
MGLFYLDRSEILDPKLLSRNHNLFRLNKKFRDLTHDLLNCLNPEILIFFNH